MSTGHITHTVGHHGDHRATAVPCEAPEATPDIGALLAEVERLTCESDRHAAELLAAMARGKARIARAEMDVAVAIAGAMAVLDDAGRSVFADTLASVELERPSVNDSEPF